MGIASRMFLSFVLVICFLTWCSQAQAGFIVNGGFETGDFTGWTLTNDDGSNGVDNLDPHSGLYEAYFGQFTEDGLVSLSQVVTTTPGMSYNFSFWVMAEAGSGLTDEFRASFGGQTLLDLSNVGPFGYTLYDFTVAATSTSSFVQFNVGNDISFFDLDDVNLSPATIPEPISMISLGIGMVTLAAYSVYRGKRSQ